MSGAGTIVIITGTTGSGKTTTCREFIGSADDLWLHFGIDTFLGVMTPRQFVDGGPRCNEGVHMEPDDPANPQGPSHLALGRLGMPLIQAYHEMLATASRAGRNTIADHITLLDPPLLQDCVARLAGLPVLLVALRPPEKLLLSRIEDRLPEVIKVLGPELGKRNNEGTKRASLSIAGQIFRNGIFDLVLDSGALSPPEVASAIRARLARGPGDAFARLAAHFAGRSSL